MELNTTEVSHSASLVGVEVFAEPESTICLRGRKSDTTQEKEVTSETAEASSSATAEPSISDSLSSMEPQMIKAFGPVSRTWFFQCDRARFVSFYFSGLLLGTLKASLKRPTDNQYPFFFAYSEDGFYATWIKAPLEGGQWSVEAVSLSPFHGMRMAQPQPLLRTKPIQVRIDGIPVSVRRGETLAKFSVMARNNMPISLQV